MIRKKLVLAAVGIAALALPFAVGSTNASQSGSAPALSFEVASIKPSKPGARGSMVHLRPGGRIVTNNVTVELLLEEVYHVTKSQISGAPSWIASEGYDIDAKPEDSVAATIDKLPPEQRLDKIKEMVRALLVDRFKLVVGRDTKEMPVYALVVAKNGPKFHESTYKPPEKLSDSPPSPGKGGPPQQGIYMTGGGNLTVAYGDIGRFADALSRNLNRIVIDKTGLTGKYDFTLKWTPDLGQGPMMPGEPGPGREGPAGAPPPPEVSGPSLFTALQEQLGASEIWLSFTL